MCTGVKNPAGGGEEIENIIKSLRITAARLIPWSRVKRAKRGMSRDWWRQGDVWLSSVGSRTQPHRSPIYIYTHVTHTHTHTYEMINIYIYKLYVTVTYVRPRVHI